MINEDKEFLYTELFGFLTGKKLGSGLYRTVYEYKLDLEFVIKIAKNVNSRQINFLEMAIWEELTECEKLNKWLAPCKTISSCGSYLLQKRAAPLEHTKYPKKIPIFLSDLKYENFGLLNGKFVCFDYGGLFLTHRWSTALKKADWWSASDS